MKRFINIWKNNREIREEYDNDFELYLEAMRLYLEECDKLNQVS